VVGSLREKVTKKSESHKGTNGRKSHMQNFENMSRRGQTPKFKNIR